MTIPNYEIRLKAVKLVLEGGLSVREAGCHLGCGRSQVHLWVTYFFMSNERKKFVMCISKRRHLYFLSMRINIGTCFSHR